MRKPILLLLLPLLVSCSYEDMLQKLLPKEESAFAQSYLENVRAKRFDEVKKRLSTELLTPEVDSKLSEVAGYFPDGDLIEVKPIGSNVFTTPDTWRASLTYQYRFTNGWAVANVVLDREKEGLVVKGINVTRLQQSLEEINAFTLKEKSAIHYLFLSLAVVIPAFILYALVLCVRTPMSKRKWPWIVFILFGVAGFHLDWTSGQTATHLLSAHLFGAAATAASPYAPWIFTLTVPLGAIVFLVRRRSLAQQRTST